MDALAKWLIQPVEVVLVPIASLVVAAFILGWLHDVWQRRAKAASEASKRP